MSGHIKRELENTKDKINLKHSQRKKTDGLQRNGN